MGIVNSDSPSSNACCCVHPIAVSHIVLPMALHVKALNNDTSFLLSFIPSICPIDQKFPETFPGAFTILVDPVAPTDQLDELPLARQSSIVSLTDVPEPDAILISQALPDHCHEDSLCQLSPHVQSMIVGEPT